MKSNYLLALLLLPAATSLRADLLLSDTMTFVQEGGGLDPGNIAMTGAAFALDTIAGGTLPSHSVPHLNDGLFGNGFSWIGATASSYAGIGFSSSQTIAGFAFGRSNVTSGDPCAGGVCTDRCAGTYTIQTTTDADPATTHATATWTTVGTITIANGVGVVTGAWKRHQYNINTPVAATGFRIIAPNGAAIDEIEILTTPAPGGVAAMVVTPASGFSVTWDGNDGDNAGLAVPNNVALASNGGTAFASGALAGGATNHQIANLNDGVYGNLKSWIGNTSPTPNAGIMLGSVHEITSIAFGRSNVTSGDPCAGGVCTDRNLGTYTLQRSLNGVAWETVATIAYNYGQDAAPGGGFSSHLRHEFELADTSGGLDALGLRLLTPNDAIAIDEIELIGSAGVDPDPDGDGYFSTLEIALGFDPNNFDSSPEGIIEKESAVEFSFYASGLKSYRIESSTDAENWTLVEDNIPGTGGQISRCYYTEGQPARTFRAVALP